MLTIPECDTTTLQTKERDRSRQTDVPTSDPTILLELFTFHHKDRRQYVTHVRGVKLVEGGLVRSFSLTDYETWQVITAGARYSARGLHDAHAAALAQLDHAIVVDPQPLVALVLAGTRLSD